jgi:hypothetical protein
MWYPVINGVRYGACPTEQDAVEFLRAFARPQDSTSIRQ